MESSLSIAAAYIRVSTDDQTEYSPDAQLKAIKSYCKKNKLFLDNKYVFVDEGKSGRKAEKRPEFMRMISVAKSKPKPFDVILVHKFDRFARNREDSVVYKSLLNKDCGIKVISITETIENDKMSLIMESMLEAMAEYYSINLSEEVKKGMTEKAYRGEPQTSPPFGYDMRDKKFIINEREAKVVKMIFNDFASGAGYFNIAHKVNDMGVRTHRGNLFENRTVEYILRNPVYIGHIRWNPKEKTKRNYNHPDIITVKGNHEPIISNELFVKCQKRVEEIKKLYRPYYKPNTNPSHWLIGLCKCADCGGAVIKSGSQFQCNNYVHGKCFSHSVSTKKIEKFVLQNMNDLINTSDYSAFNISNISSKRINDDKYLYEVYDLEKRLERCKIAYQEGIDSLSEYKSNKSVITAELERVKKKIDLNNKVDDTPDYETLVHNLKITYDILTDENKTMQEKYKSSHEIISKVIVSKGNIDIEYFV